MNCENIYNTQYGNVYLLTSNILYIRHNIVCLEKPQANLTDSSWWILSLFKQRQNTQITFYGLVIKLTMWSYSVLVKQLFSLFSKVVT